MNGLNPDLIVVTGGVAGSLAPLEAEIRQRAGRYALPDALATTRIRVVASDKRRTILGGATLVQSELGRRRGPEGAAASKGPGRGRC